MTNPTTKPVIAPTMMPANMAEGDDDDDAGGMGGMGGMGMDSAGMGGGSGGMNMAMRRLK